MQPWETLRISRASYFRYKASKYHASLTPRYDAFRSGGLFMRPWSQSHQKHCLQQLRNYFKVYPVVNYWGVLAWMEGNYVKKKARHTALSGFAKFLVNEELMDETEFLKIRAIHPKKPPYYRPRQRIIQREDLETLLTAAQESHVRSDRLLNITMLIVLSETALRVSELCNLQPAHLHFSSDPTKAYLEVICGKGGKDRLVPFSKKAQEATRNYLEKAPGQSSEKAVFQTLNSKLGYTKLTRSSISRRFKILSDRTGIEFSAHSFRHYRITAWANNPRIPIVVTQRWAGHSDLETTQRYIHLSDAQALLAAFE